MMRPRDAEAIAQAVNVLVERRIKYALEVHDAVWFPSETLCFHAQRDLAIEIQNAIDDAIARGVDRANDS